MKEQRYDILKLLGKGRTGGVYEAEDSRLNRKVAMRRFFSQDELTDVEEYEDEFKEIAQSLSSLQHPNLLRVFDAGMDDDGAFIISQLMQGDTLHNRLKEGSLSDWDSWDLGHQMLDSLATAHAGGFIHGAITPGSILMSPRARGGSLYVILDMGLSRLAPLIQGDDSVLSMMADPAILAPELFDGAEASAQSDLYMLGNILFMCLAGGHPFAGKSLDECAKLHLEGLPDLRKFAPEAPQEFLDWIKNLCEIDPELRPESAVIALQSMPKVAKPVKVGMRSSAATSHLVTNIPPAHLATPAPSTSYSDPSTGMVTTGPINAGTAAQTENNQVSSEHESVVKSYKALIITISAIALLGLSLYLIMSGAGKKTGEQIAADKALKAKNNQGVDSIKIPDPDKKNEQSEPKKKPIAKEKVADVKTGRDKPSTKLVPDEVPSSTEIVLMDPTKGNFSAQKWDINDRSHHKSHGKDLVVMHSPKGVNILLKKSLKDSDIKSMFDNGWSMKYVVSVREGKHRVGIKIRAEQNKYWGDKSNSVQLLLQLERKDGDLLISRLNSTEKHEVKDVNMNLVTIELRGKASDPAGSYQMLVNGEVVPSFKGSILQKSAVVLKYPAEILIASGYSGNKRSTWVVRKISLSKGTQQK